MKKYRFLFFTIWGIVPATFVMLKVMHVESAWVDYGLIFTIFVAIISNAIFAWDFISQKFKRKIQG